MEKYDGIRAMWEPDIGGECGFRTKGGVRTWKCSHAEMRDALLGGGERQTASIGLAAPGRLAAPPAGRPMRPPPKKGATAKKFRRRARRIDI